MGRYYNGDINGKFYFGVQSSNDASFFGGSECEPNYIEYYFDSNDLEDIENGIKECKEELGELKQQIDKFFNDVNGYNDKIIADYWLKEFGVDLEYKDGVYDMEKKIKLEWYARLELGEKILKCVKDNGECTFEAEL